MLDEPVAPRDRLVRELQRVQDRLATLNLPRLAVVADDVHACASTIARVTLRLEGRPQRDLPRLGDETVGAALMVSVHDLLAVARTSDHVELGECADALTGLRRSLP